MNRKTVFILNYLLIFVYFGCGKLSDEKRTESCYTKKNFDLVFKFIEDQNNKTKSKYFKYQEVKVYITNDTTITLEKNNSFSKIYRESGIFPLLMYMPQNVKMKEEANHLFYEITKIIKE